MQQSCQLLAIGFACAFDRMFLNRYHQHAGWSSLVARWAHNPKVGGSNPPPATKQVPDYKCLPSQPEGVSVALAHNLLTEFQPRISHLHDPPFCLVCRRRTKQVVELLHYPAVVVSDQVRVAHGCPRADVSETLLSYFHRSVQAVLRRCVPMPEGMESALKPQLLQQRLELPLHQVFGMQPLTLG